jgi:hypothetical protein
MPYKAPGSLEVDDTYAIAAYILSLNGIRAADGKLDKQSMPKIKMPNRDGFAPDPEFSAEKRTVIVHGMRVSRLGVNRLANLTPHRRPILTPLRGGVCW